MTEAALVLVDEFSSLSQGWMWVDEFGDCAYTLDHGLVIRAANNRDIWDVNLSAPRALRPMPADLRSAAIEVTCAAGLPDRPAIGGLLLWRDKRNYLWVRIGTFSARQVTLGGCIDDKDLIIGRGQLPGGAAWAMDEHIVIRLEVFGESVRALCSLDGEQWYTVGHTSFPMDDAVEVGVHAIGDIDRTIYHGAYPDGTAIRFASFKLWARSGVGMRHDCIVRRIWSGRNRRDGPSRCRAYVLIDSASLGRVRLTVSLACAIYREPRETLNRGGEGGIARERVVWISLLQHFSLLVAVPKAWFPRRQDGSYLAASLGWPIGVGRQPLHFTRRRKL